MESLDRMMEFFREYGDTYRVALPSRKRDAIVIHHPEDVKHVFITNHGNYVKGVGLDRVKILLGNGIMVSEGEFWRRQRRMIQPAFHRRTLERFSELIESHNRELLDRWDGLAGAGPIDVTDEMSELALGIILRAIFSEDLEFLVDRAGGNPFAVVSEESNRDLKFAMKFRALGKLVREVVERRRAEKRLPMDFLSMMMEARDEVDGSPMTEKELLDETMTLIVAGHETTASSLNWTWLLLAENPEAEAKLHHEVDEAIGDRIPSVPELGSLPWTEMVIREALRLYPPGWLLTRRTIGADTLGGYSVAPDTDVLVSPYVIHRHPEYWPDPEKFQPERFGVDESRERNRFVYFPFGLGARRCVGELLAIFEMHIHIAVVARRFRLRRASSEPIEMEPQVNLRTRRNLLMTLERRR